MIILFVFPSYSTSPTLALNETMLLALIVVQHLPVPAVVPIPTETSMFLNPVPLTLKLTLSELLSIGLNFNFKVVEECTKLKTSRNTIQKREIFFILIKRLGLLIIGKY